MRKALLLVSLCLFVAAFISCEPEEYSSSGGGKKSSSVVRDTVRVSVDYMSEIPDFGSNSQAANDSEAIEQTGIAPTLVLDSDDSMLIHYVDSNNPDLTIFYYQRHSIKAGAGVLMIAGEKNIFFIPVYGFECSIEALMMTASDDFSTVSSGYFNIQTGGDFEVHNVSKISWDPVVKSTFEKQMKGSYLSMLDKLESSGSDTADALDIIFCNTYLGELAASMFSTITKIGALGGRLVMAESKEEMEEIINKFYIDFFETQIIELIARPFPKNRFTVFLKKAAKRLIGRDPDDDSYDDEYYASECMEYSIFGVNGVVPQILPCVVEEYPTSAAYDLSVSVDNITETSATFHGKVDYDYWQNSSMEMGILDQGYVLYESGGEGDFYSSTDMAPKTVKLNKGRKYTVRAFVKTLVDTYYSEPRVFYTKGSFLEVSPDSFTFSSSGGSSTATISIPDGGSLRITSSPNWCETSASSVQLSLSASSTKSSRSGNVVLECTNFYGEKATKTVSVTQEVPVPGQGNWNGTAWRMTGKVYYYELDGTEAGFWDFDETISIVDVDKNEFTSSYWTGVYYNNSGNLVLHHYTKESTSFFNSYVIEEWDLDCVMSRIDNTHARGSVTGTFKGGYGTPELQKTYKGTLEAVKTN